MEMKVNSEVIKALRKQRAWSQDELAAASGISLRTIQRIENSGNSSLESKKALAAVFEIDVAALEIDEEAIVRSHQIERGRRNGILGATIGVSFAVIAVVYSFISGGATQGELGMYLGLLGAMYGSVCGLISFMAKKQQIG